MSKINLFSFEENILSRTFMTLFALASGQMKHCIIQLEKVFFYEKT